MGNPVRQMPAGSTPARSINSGAAGGCSRGCTAGVAVGGVALAVDWGEVAGLAASRAQSPHRQPSIS